ncbi:hypothetical protein DL766_009959 [Monosporascus sp. MC13-8B]|uniref:SRR1-like domain-containing protein n=1 Tax=Monosporascus cannonballus TaxID=155416 RepID=A0ABY0GZE3_9PEZI|nr:hypothetical protein DL762_007408 [Monosporascus cannonballus]RYO81315.1 hypothetical protein DL763_008621 [Monosporascus cannonballus]RYP12430.1 hypothetical protein DL766_009959 [Monosporascus sp. MC13-8B]
MAFNPNPKINQGRLDSPPDRQFMLSCGADDMRRRDIIEQRGNAIVQFPRKLTPDQIHNWLETGDPHKQPHTGTDEEAHEQAHEQFLRWGEEFNDEVDGRELRDLFTRLHEDGKLPCRQIDKIVCFSLGSFATGGSKTVDMRSVGRYAAARIIGRVIAGLTGRDVLPIYAQDPDLNRTDISVLRRVGIRAVNPYLHEGHVLVDRGALVASVDAADGARLEQMVLECSAPAAILMTDFRHSSLGRIADAPRVAAYAILAREYMKVLNVQALEDEDEMAHLGGASLYIRKAQV